jgi:hypothetical protein
MGKTCSKLAVTYVYNALLGKPEGKLPNWRPERRWEVNIKIECQGVKLIYLAHCGALLSKVINLLVLQNVRGGGVLDQLSDFKFLKRIL